MRAKNNVIKRKVDKRSIDDFKRESLSGFWQLLTGFFRRGEVAIYIGWQQQQTYENFQFLLGLFR